MATPKNKFNIILISWHDLGKHLHCYGRGDVSSPNLDELANEGMRFDNFFSTCPMCSPARGSMLTGRWPHVNGLQALTNRGWDLPLEERTMENYLKDAGYFTRLFGFQHERTNPADFGFDEMWIESTHCDDVAEAVCSFLMDWKGAEPFFARIGFQQAHRPWGKYSAGDPDTVDSLPFLPDSEPIRRQLTQFHQCIEHADRRVGQILGQLKASGLERNTLVIFTTDHGIGFPRAKGTLYDPGLETAMIMKLPNVIKAGTVAMQLLSNIDLLPTVLELLGIEMDFRLFNGKSFLKVLQGDKGDVNTAIYGERSWGDDYQPKRCIRTNHYKYILNFEALPRISAYGGGEDVFGDDILKYLTAGYRNPVSVEELYDIQKDSYEQTNLVAFPDQCEQTLDEMRAMLIKWMRETNDPLLDGPIVSPNYKLVMSSLFEGNLPEKPLVWNPNLRRSKHKTLKHG